MYRPLKQCTTDAAETGDLAQGTGTAILGKSQRCNIHLQQRGLINIIIRAKLF